MNVNSNVINYLISHSRNCKESGTSKGLWDHLGRQMDIMLSKCIVGHFLSVVYM